MKIIIPGNPRAKMRHRTFARKTKSGKTFVGTYNPQKPDEGSFIEFLMTQIPKDLEPITDPIYIQIWYGLPRPVSHYGTGKNAGKLKPSAPKYPARKPDIDNFEKFIFDCLNGIIYKDDSQICSCRHDKRYSENPRTEIEVRRLF